jgi:F-type H+-transporting ATPase subunit delta
MKGGLYSSEIAEPYAQALMSVAQNQNLTEVLGNDLRDLLTLLNESPELEEMLANPIIKDEDKKLFCGEF